MTSSTNSSQSMNLPLICICFLLFVSGLAIAQLISNKVVEDRSILNLNDCSYADSDTQVNFIKYGLVNLVIGVKYLNDII